MFIAILSLFIMLSRMETFNSEVHYFLKKIALDRDPIIKIESPIWN